MKKPGNSIVLLTVFVAGFLTGTVFAVWKMDKLHPVHQIADSVDEKSPAGQIVALQKHLEKNPHDATAWRHLGNLYYDSEQSEKAIEAYQQALQSAPADANILTDLGVMYRKTKQPEKAIDYFDKAIKRNSHHLPSRFNKGIVLLNDLEKPHAAIAVWKEILAIDSDATTGSGQKVADIIVSVEKNIALTGQTKEQK